MGLVVGIAVASACGSGSAATEPDEPAEAATSTTRTPRVVDDSGRPQITFDPCLDIPDELLIEAGYDPKSEEVTDYPMGSYTFLVCGYDGTLHIPGELFRYGQNIFSGNVTLEEEQAKDGDISTATTINGRRALIEVDRNTKNSCAIAVETTFGIVIFSRRYYADHTRGVPQAAWCAGLDELATSIEPLRFSQ
ncbi:DUF3558 domain-containing protein [Rhodococcus chondri]|uniref:DUF3558 domain-containing protein n=1 Tax=Rhodococcus chondri TaxID=3065941 RepID=A0ABU7JY79_9NOCA|nr:DUF3558 domain-containing protein [Rhodococcus sp. CC-R104]MEE2034958.1 DUF3558 domain-containing protein [Rhodococcus sp. CC-R104]